MHDMCRQGSAVFFSTHVLDVAEKLCNKVAIIRQGKIIAAGDMEEIVQGQTLEEAFLEADSDEE
jgi:ABC-2 type transport system ATP-binding protein